MTWLAVQSLHLQALEMPESFLLGLGLRRVAQKRNGFLVSDVKIEWLKMS